MCRRSWLWLGAIFVAVFCSAPETARAAEVKPSVRGDIPRADDSALADGFLNPPASARPGAYWAWMNGNVNLPQLTRDLEEMKDKGLSSALIFDVGARDPDRVVPAGPAFMGPESLQAICHAIREATRLGVDIGFVTSSSWNAGGPWVTPEHASMALYQSQVTVKGPVQFSQVLPSPSFPKTSPRTADGSPVYSRETAVLAFPESAEKRIADPKSIVNLTSRLDKNGRLTWDVPAGLWTILRLVCANTGQQLAIPGPNSGGLVIDHFNPEATEMHFKYLIDRLKGGLGSFENTALKYLYLCSYEVRGLIWTPRLLQEFQQRHGYDMTPYLPVLFGYTVQNKEMTDRFKYDFDKTLGDLIVDNFYRKAREMSHQQGLLLCAEAGGPGPPTHNVPVDALKALGSVDILRGEFWNQHTLWVVKETACASHIYGRRVVDMESFTSWRHWLDGPFELKPLADRAMCDGTNHFTFHTFAHNPPEAGLPGWVYHAGTHINVNLTWWPKAKPFIAYLARCCSLLQQGLFVGDVCYYYGDQAFNFVPPKQVDPSLGFGYDYDVTNAEALLDRMEVREGRIVLPDGLSYELLVLPDREDMDWDVLQKIEKLVQAGATVVGRKPTRSNGLSDFPRRDERVKALAEKLWADCDGDKVKEHSYGKGRIVWGQSLRDVLQTRGLGPDFSFTSRNSETALDYIHRRTKDADIYFVSNKSLRWEEANCTFRVRGKQPELWMPDTGERRKQVVYDVVEGGTKVPLRLPPAGSVFVVFRDKADTDRIVSVRSDGGQILPLSSGSPQELPAIEVRPGQQSSVELLAWKPGTYSLETAQGKKATVTVEKVPPAHEITGPWEVRFPKGWGAPASKVFPKLMSWTEDPEDGVKYFSGIATYSKEFDLPAEMTRENTQIVLDLGQVRAVADVSVNGKPLGILWKPPFRVDVTRAVKPSANRLVVEVANLWANRLIGDAGLPKDKRFCRTNMTHALTYSSPWKETPLLESGLLGPVRLLAAKRIAVKMAE